MNRDITDSILREFNIQPDNIKHVKYLVEDENGKKAELSIDYINNTYTIVSNRQNGDLEIVTKEVIILDN